MIVLCCYLGVVGPCGARNYETVFDWGRSVGGNVI